jgi:S1-C subfamily serine protease
MRSATCCGTPSSASPVRIVRLHVDVPARGADVEPRVGAGRLVYRDMLALDGSRVYAGNSGGPLLDAGGRVVGIVTLASRSTPQAFAIPVSRVIGKLKSLAGS